MLDNAHMMDSASWDLYEAIRDGCYRVAIILLLQTDHNEGVRIHPACRDTFERVWQSPSMEDNRVIELPRFNTKSLEEMLLYNATKYQETYMNEVTKMTEIVDKKNTIKDEDEGAKKRKELIKQY